MAKKPTTPASSGPQAPTGHRLNREKILEDLRTNRSYRGGSGTDRKALFNVKLPCKVWVLPDIRPRGIHAEPLPYLHLATHWMHRVSKKDGAKFRQGVTCVDHLCENEPGTYNRLLQEKVLKDERCPICEVLSAWDEKEFPKDRFGRPELAAQEGFHFQVVKEESESKGDDHPIKVLSARATGMQNFMSLVSKDDIPGAAKFETEGMYTSWEKGDKSWIVMPLVPKKLWLKDWQKKILDLELITPTFIPREEIVSDLTWNLPQFPIAKFFNVKMETVEEGKPGKALPPRKKTSVEPKERPRSASSKRGGVAAVAKA